MKNILFYLILILIVGGCKTREAFLTKSPPIQPEFPEQMQLTYLGAPPIMQPINKPLDEIEVSAQYFKIAVPIVIDKTGRLEGIKNLIDGPFTTFLDESKRFITMDNALNMNIMNQIYESILFTTQGSRKSTSESEEITNKKYKENNMSLNNKSQEFPASKTIDTSNNVDSLKTKTKRTDTKLAPSDFYGWYETHPQAYAEYLKELSSKCDGILRIEGSGNDSTSKKNNFINIDYRIISSGNNLIYSGSGPIRYKMREGTTNKSLFPEDIKKIVKQITDSFPNKIWKIENIIEKPNRRMIVVNAGLKNYIKPGMIGFVFRKDGNRTVYRAIFEVKNVDLESFTAELQIEPFDKLKDKGVTEFEYSQYPNILKNIRVGEMVRMK